jgi:hypothetical protein
LTGEREQVVLVAIKGVLESCEFFGEESRLLVHDQAPRGPPHGLRVPVDDVGDQPARFLGGQVGPFPLPLERVAAQHERVAVLREGLGDAGPHRGSPAVGPEKRHAEVASAFRHAHGRPGESAGLEVGGDEQVPCQVCRMVQLGSVLIKIGLDGSCWSSWVRSPLCMARALMRARRFHTVSAPCFVW